MYKHIYIHIHQVHVCTFIYVYINIYILFAVDKCRGSCSKSPGPRYVQEIVPGTLRTGIGGSNFSTSSKCQAHTYSKSSAGDQFSKRNRNSSVDVLCKEKYRWKLLHLILMLPSNCSMAVTWRLPPNSLGELTNRILSPSLKNLIGLDLIS